MDIQINLRNEKKRCQQLLSPVNDQQKLSTTDVYSVAQSYPTLCEPLDCSLPGFPIHIIFQARIFRWVPISFSRDLSYPGIEPVSLLCLLPCRLILHPLSYRENCLVDCLCDSFSDGHFHTSFDHLGTSTHAHGLSNPLGKDGMHVWAPKQDLLFSKDMLANNYWHPSYQQQR